MLLLSLQKGANFLMSRYFIRRILETIPLMLIISIFVFMFIHLIPGDPARSIAGLDAEEWEVEAIREEYGLNKPIIVQYVDYMVKLFKGDMGRSMKSDTPVTELIADRMPQTLKLVFAGVLWAPVLGIFIGVISAIKHGKMLDRRQHADCDYRSVGSRFLARSDGYSDLLGTAGLAAFRWSGQLERIYPSFVYHGMWYHGSTCKIFPFLHAGNSA